MEGSRAKMIDPQDDTLAFTSAVELQKLVVSGKVDVSELLDYFFQRIKATDGKYSSFLHLNTEGVEGYVESLKKNGDIHIHPLMGVPLVIPDSLHLKETPMTYGSKLLENHISKEDSAEVANLKGAGAFVLGKTNISEFSIAYETRNELIPPTRNPLNLKFSPGGPAGGSGAAVAAGLAPCALASDITGGLRLTASFCGLIGLMPTRGAIPIKYKHFLTYSDQMLFRKGIIARCVEDIALLFDFLMIHQVRDKVSSCVLNNKTMLEAIKPQERGMRIAMSEDLGYVCVDPQVRKVLREVRKKLESMGHCVEEIQTHINPDCDQHMRHMLAADRANVILRLLREVGKTPDRLGSYARSALEEGDAVTGIQYSMGTVAIEWMKKRMGEILIHYDMLLVPTAPIGPYPIANIHKAEIGITGEQVNQSSLLTAPFNMSGNPVITLPGGLSREGLPIGFQLVGRLFEESRLLNIAKAYTQTN